MSVYVCAEIVYARVFLSVHQHQYSRVTYLYRLHNQRILCIDIWWSAHRNMERCCTLKCVMKSMRANTVVPKPFDAWPLTRGCVMWTFPDHSRDMRGVQFSPIWMGFKGRTMLKQPVEVNFIVFIRNVYFFHLNQLNHLANPSDLYWPLEWEPVHQ